MESAYDRLNSLYDYVVGDIDVEITEITAAKKPDVEKSDALADRFTKEVTKKLDDAIDELAAELNLKVGT